MKKIAKYSDLTDLNEETKNVFEFLKKKEFTFEEEILLEKLLKKGYSLTEDQIDELILKAKTISNNYNILNILIDFDLPYTENQRQEIFIISAEKENVFEKALNKWKYLRKETLHDLIKLGNISIFIILKNHGLIPNTKEIVDLLESLPIPYLNSITYLFGNEYDISTDKRKEILRNYEMHPISGGNFSNIVNTEALKKFAIELKDYNVTVTLIQDNLLTQQDINQILTDIFQYKEKFYTEIYPYNITKIIVENNKIDKEMADKIFLFALRYIQNIPYRMVSFVNLINTYLRKNVYIPEYVKKKIDQFARVLEYPNNTDEETTSNFSHFYDVYKALIEWEALPIKKVLLPTLQKALSELRSFLKEKNGFVSLKELRIQPFFTNPQIKQYLLKEHPKGLSFEDLKEDFDSNLEFKIMLGEYDAYAQALEDLTHIKRETFVLLFEDIASAIGFKNDPGFEEFRKDILEQLKHGEHTIGIPGKTFGWALFRKLDQNTYFIEQIQTDLLRLLPRLKETALINNLKESWQKLVDKYGEENLDRYQKALNKAVKNYFEIILSAFLQEHRGADIYISSPEIIRTTVGEKGPELDYKQIPPKFHFKLLSKFPYVQTPVPVWYKHNASIRKLAIKI